MEKTDPFANSDSPGGVLACHTALPNSMTQEKLQLERAATQE